MKEAAHSHRCLEVVELPPGPVLADLLELHRDRAYVALLESHGAPSKLSRWSYLAGEPFLVFRSKRNQAFAGPPGDLEPLPGDPLAELGALLERYKCDASLAPPGAPPFVGGAVGYLGYEMLYLLEDVPDRGRDDLALPDAYFLFCDVVFAADSAEKKLWLMATGFGATPDEAARAAGRRVDETRARLRDLARADRTRESDAMRARFRAIREARPRLGEEDLDSLGVAPVVGREGYLEAIRAAKDHILAGNVFEICLCNRFDTSTRQTGAEIYAALVATCQTPFCAYLRFPEMEVLSSSPEQYLRLDRDRWASTRPMKGTRPRGRTPEEDRRLRDELASSEKDAAENIMIVDLARNDLGRVCGFRTVTVPELRVIESYPFTHQMVSTVRGRLRPDRSAMDLVRATFPGGSMTGAPKVESMKVIDLLEPVKRGVFAGGIGYFDFDGALELNIVIRTLIKTGDKIVFHAGGAIVADSDPEEEYQETLDKAHAMVTALQIARERAEERR